MRIDFERRGGYAGLKLDYSVELEQLPAAQAEELRSLVQASGFKRLTVSKPKSGPPDVMTYRITLHEAAKSHSLEVTDLNAPDGLKPLLTRLVELAIASRAAH